MFCHWPLSGSSEACADECAMSVRVDQVCYSMWGLTAELRQSSEKIRRRITVLLRCTPGTSLFQHT